MKDQELNDQGERLVLKHEPVKPYPLVFWLCFLGGLAYLLVIYFTSFGAGGH